MFKTVPQIRPIEDIWGILKQMVYTENCQARDLDQLARRIREKINEIDKKKL